MSEIKIRKYVLEITTYPNGKEYQKIYPLGKEQAVRRTDAKKKSEAKKAAVQKTLDEQTPKFNTEGNEEVLW